MKLPDGLTLLAERQTCSNKMNERAAFEMFEKCSAIGECIHTAFIQIFAWKVTTNYTYLSKE